jgi:ATP-dependent DNA ligase
VDADQERREECRREVLRFLVNRNAVASRADTIRNALAREFNFTMAEINAALAFHDSAGHVVVEPDPHGATKFYRATADGVLFHERNS